jgi:hypothetical protein
MIIGLYANWNRRPDVIIFGVQYTSRGKLTSKYSPNYNDFLIGHEGYAEHVADKGAICKSSPGSSFGDTRPKPAL